MLRLLSPRQRPLLVIASVGLIYLFYTVFLSQSDTGSYFPFSLSENGFWGGKHDLDADDKLGNDGPIPALMEEANVRWQAYEDNRSATFKETVTKYRTRYGRHPPPGFKEWYQFARERNVHNIDDFDQIMDDLRPFWAVAPRKIRESAAFMCDDDKSAVAGIHIRNKAIVNVTNPSWRSDTLVTLIERFAEYLPDMDIAMNRMDQPRTLVKWEDMQTMLAEEARTRHLPAEASDSFTADMAGFKGWQPETTVPDENLDWSGIPSRQYMELAALACPPESPARNSQITIQDADLLYKGPLGGLVTNFNLSTDLCTVGPAIQDLHGFLFSSSSISASQSLVPIFSECKVNVNSDILFPANMYWKKDERYDYDPKEDLKWRKKEETLFWRGVTSGGVQVQDNWDRMHRQRFAHLTNATKMEGKEVNVLTRTAPVEQEGDGNYENFPHYHPSHFADEYFDYGFTAPMSCVPNCDFYDSVYRWKEGIPMAHQFRYKYLVDIDGHSFSGRWRAFLFSRSLGIKATIFREWHDSRLFAWRHFVPLDNRYDDLYTLMTYFIGIGKPDEPGPFVPRHDHVAKHLATQGRDWAQQVLRGEDIEIYMFRLLLEYARIIDDNRDVIGYSGDGSELSDVDERVWQWI